ncbi:MAG: AAA family ATPase, partial [Candidatus Diapherotrites archaeon]|nr:AAA family ATPase [Candidatus Diapherotrites archaeon]
MGLPWTEKYRPKRLDQIIGHTDVVSRLKAYVKNRNMPNLLFSGPQGTGKTCCSVAIAREVFGDNYRANFLELNASDDRGIGVVRKDIKDFART